MSQGVQTTATGLEGDAEDGGLIRVEGLRYLGLFSVLTVLKCGRAEGAGAGAPVQLASPQLEESRSRQTSLLPLPPPPCVFQGGSVIKPAPPPCP